MTRRATPWRLVSRATNALYRATAHVAGAAALLHVETGETDQRALDAEPLLAEAAKELQYAASALALLRRDWEDAL